MIPFLEFALPFLLRIFPNMLPSTYEDKLKKEEELKRRLSIKLELARFLQDTVAEVAKDVAQRKGSGSAAELFEFIKKVRRSPEELFISSQRKDLWVVVSARGAEDRVKSDHRSLPMSRPSAGPQRRVG